MRCKGRHLAAYAPTSDAADIRYVSMLSRDRLDALNRCARRSYSSERFWFRDNHLPIRSRDEGSLSRAKFVPLAAPRRAPQAKQPNTTISTVARSSACAVAQQLPSWPGSFTTEPKLCLPLDVIWTPSQRTRTMNISINGVTRTHIIVGRPGLACFRWHDMAAMRIGVIRSSAEQLPGRTPSPLQQFSSHQIGTAVFLAARTTARSCAMIQTIVVLRRFAPRRGHIQHKRDYCLSDMTGYLLLLAGPGRASDTPNQYSSPFVDTWRADGAISGPPSLG